MGRRIREDPSRAAAQRGAPEVRVHRIRMLG